MKYCKKCGKQLSDEAKFCTGCEHNFENSNPQGASKTSDFSHREDSAAEKNRSRKRKGVLIGIICAVAAVAVLFCVFGLPAINGNKTVETESIGYFVRYDVDKDGESGSLAYVKDGQITEVELPDDDLVEITPLQRYGREGCLMQTEDEAYYVSPGERPVLLTDNYAQGAPIANGFLYYIRDYGLYLYYTDYEGNILEFGDGMVPVGISPDGSQIITVQLTFEDESVKRTAIPVNGRTEFDIDKNIKQILCVFNDGSFIYDYMLEPGESSVRLVSEEGEKELYDGDAIGEWQYVIYDSDGLGALICTDEGEIYHAYAYGDGGFYGGERLDEHETIETPVFNKGELTVVSSIREGQTEVQYVVPGKPLSELLPHYLCKYDHKSSNNELIYDNGDRVLTSDVSPAILGDIVQYCRNGQTYIATLNGGLKDEKKIADEAGELYLKPAGTKGYIKGKKNIFYVENGSSEKIMKASNAKEIHQSVSGKTAVILDDDGNARIFRKDNETDVIKRADKILLTLRTIGGGSILDPNAGKYIDDDILLYVQNGDLYLREKGNETILLEDVEVLQ